MSAVVSLWRNLDEDLVQEAVNNACTVLVSGEPADVVDPRGVVEKIVAQRIRHAAYGWPAGTNREQAADAIYDGVVRWLVARVRAAEQTSFPPDAPSTGRPPPVWCERCNVVVDEMGCACGAAAGRPIPLPL